MKRDSSLKVFQSRDKSWVTYGELVQAMRNVKADDCEVLLIHTDLSFGLPSRDLKRKELVEILFDAICELEVNTLVFPTFTFSYGNHEDYDVLNTKCKMGMINEYARKREDAIRSEDPLMSVCVIGDHKELAEVSGNKSLGAGSFFDRFHQIENARILFFGSRLPQCHTHMHYVEEKLRVPYRYDKEFEGHIIDKEGNIREDKHILYVKYRDVIPCVPPSFEKELIEQGVFLKQAVGDSYVSSFTEKAAYDKAVEWLTRDVNCFLAEPYDSKPLVKEYSYGNVTTVQ
ncbi:MAG: AAC(3) family N-acetyltransferase [Lachnospiraceae bacterium]|nr:AAC(3) family N-acetyltransferase [Lachnospiraceae bacterium]